MMWIEGIALALCIPGIFFILGLWANGWFDE